MKTNGRPPYGAVANVYDAFLTLSGFKRGVENFLRRMALDLPPRPRLLDAGCGTGLLTFYLARRFPHADIYASDIDANMLRAMERILKREGIGRSNITIALGDLRTPERLHKLGTHESIAVPENHFDGIFVSGALEHVPLQETILRLGKLLKPGGILFNLGVRRSPAGAVLGMVWRFRPYRLAEMRQACAAAGLNDIRILRLSAADFPANLSRVAIMARKKIESRM